MARYAIWNKKDSVITPIGEVLTAEQWIERYPMAGLESITVICAAGEINGAIFATLGQMKANAEKMGCDFSACTADEEILQAIENFEDYLEAQAAEEAAKVKSNEERTATALEAIAEGATSETKEQVAIMAEDLEALDETAIALYEEVESQTATNEVQDEALIELYELAGL